MNIIVMFSTTIFLLVLGVCGYQYSEIAGGEIHILKTEKFYKLQLAKCTNPYYKNQIIKISKGVIIAGLGMFILSLIGCIYPDILLIFEVAKGF